VSGQLHDRAALTPGNMPLPYLGWPPATVWTLWRTENISHHARNETPILRSSTPVVQSLYRAVLDFLQTKDKGKFVLGPKHHPMFPVYAPVLNFLSRIRGLTVDEIWIGEWIYWPLIDTTRNCKQSQRSPTFNTLLITTRKVFSSLQCFQQPFPGNGC
jgi:hypothetical protein